MAEIGRVAIVVELDGEPKFVALPPDRMRMLIQLAESLSDTGRLPVVKADGFRFKDLRGDRNETKGS